MRQRPLTVVIGVAALALLFVGSAYALHLRAGNIIVDGDGGFAPTRLPKNRVAPIRAFFHGSVKTVDGTRPSPIRVLTVEFDKHSALETRGLPKCTQAKLLATTTAQARKLCPGAIIGSGFGKGVVELPEQRPIEVSSPITVFNGPVEQGNPIAIGHVHIDYPGPTTYLLPGVIHKVNHGRYGYKLVIDFPKLVNGYGSPTYGRLTINRKWKYGRKTLSYASARCADGRLQARVQAAFEDGTFLQGTAFKHCTIRR